MDMMDVLFRVSQKLRITQMTDEDFEACMVAKNKAEQTTKEDCPMNPEEIERGHERIVMSDEYWEDRIMKDQNDLAVQEIIRQRDELAKALKEIAKVGHGIDWTMDDHELLKYWEDVAARGREIAREALKKAGIE